MGFSKTPYEMQREQQERAIQAQEQQQARQLAAQAWQSFANMDVGGEAPKPVNLPIDWQHGADIASKRLSALELQQLEGDQKLQQIAAQGAEHRGTSAFELGLKAKYAPKKYPGGEGPLGKLEKELWQVHDTVPADSEQALRKNQRKAAILSQLKEYGSRGQKIVDRFQGAVAQPYTYEYGPGTKLGAEQAEWNAKKKEVDADKALREADEALLKIDVKTTFGDDPTLLAAKKAAAQRVEERAKSSPQPSAGQTSTQRAAGQSAPAAPSPAAPKSSDWVKLPSGRMYNPKTGESR